MKRELELSVEPFAVACPACRAELSADIDNDPGILPQFNNSTELAKRCPRCAVASYFTRRSDGRLVLKG